MNTRPNISPVIIVTGASGGIGSQVVRLLLNQGSTVVAVSRNPASAWHLQEQNGNFLQYSADISNPGSWTNLIDAVMRRYGQIDGLIHCAGTLTPGGIDQLGDANLLEMIQTNTVGTMLGVRAILPVMRSQHYGSIVIVGSLGGAVPMPYQSIYAASKFAVRGFCLSVQEELAGSPVSLTLITPGAVQTRMLFSSIGDNRGCSAFLLNPLPATVVAQRIITALKRPCREAILPPISGRVAIFIARFPALLRGLNTLLASIRQRRIRSFIAHYTLMEER